MSLFTKSVSFLAVMAVIPASYALTARPSVIGTAAARMPTMTAAITGGVTLNGTGTTTSSLLANSECIDAYTECMKGADACGSDFEECTTKVLFHGKMPQCLSTLAQCSTAGVSSLFGTGTVSALSTVASKNTYGEVTDYTYPTDGSVMGQMIIGAAISNKYDTSTCVRRYTSCLQKDSVCGQDFELCTTDKEFRKQRVFCDSTLARCQSDGLIQLLGTANTSATPTATSRIGEMIAEGAALAAVNAVSTCYKVVDQCFLNACAENPYKCFENSTTATVNLVESINSGTAASETSTAAAISGATTGMDIITKSNISAYIKNSCLDTIGSNKYCYATFLGNGQMPTSSQLKDEDNQAEIFDEAYSSRMNAAMKAKISDLIDQFDTKAKQKCTDTIKSCVMRTCGGGSGAACYYQTFGAGAVDKSINAAQNYETLQTGCAAVINTDAYCKYAATNPTTTGSYSYTYVNNDAFSILFPEYDSKTKSDPIGAVAALNASLQSSYNDAALEAMQKRCQTVATSCVRSMCGTDYQNCYRNRTDIYSDITNTGNTNFDKSMNKVGGVLDYTIVLGLCLDTVKNASVCEEHLKIQQSRVAKNTPDSVWGNSVRGDWLDAGSATSVSMDTVPAQDEYGNALCTSRGGYGEQACYTVDADGNVYDQPVTTTYSAYLQTQAANSLFKELIYDLEKEAQAKYNAKLTKQQNLCMSANSGGVMGKNDLGSTFLWVKLKSNTVPKTYAASGLKDNQFAPSNDLYGSFCRVRVSLQSDDKKLQDVIAKGTDWAVTYFAAGDAFTCGSWVPEDALTELASKAAKDARKDAATNNGITKNWMAVLGTVAGGGLGAWGGSKIADSNFLGGLTGSGTSKSSVEAAESCVNFGNRYFSATDDSTKRTYLTKMLTSARKINTNKAPKGVEKEGLQDAIEKLTASMQKEGVLGNSYNPGDRESSCVITSTNGLDYPDTRAVVHFSCPTNVASMSNNRCYDNSGAELNWTIGTSRDKWQHEVVMQCDSNEISKVAMENYIKQNYPSPRILPNNVSVKMSYNSLASTYNATNKGELDTSVNTLSAECQLWDDDSVGQKTKSISTAIGAGVGAVAGGVLAYQATKSVQDAKLNNVEKEAYNQWMNEVGQHINCVIGGDVVGQFGDVISTSME